MNHVCARFRARVRAFRAFRACTSRAECKCIVLYIAFLVISVCARRIAFTFNLYIYYIYTVLHIYLSRPHTTRCTQKVLRLNSASAQQRTQANRSIVDRAETTARIFTSTFRPPAPTQTAQHKTQTYKRHERTNERLKLFGPQCNQHARIVSTKRDDVCCRCK